MVAMTEAPNEQQGQDVTARGLGAGQLGEEGSAQQSGAEPTPDPSAEIRRIAQKEKREGKQAREREILEALGFDDLESAATWVNEYRGIEEEIEGEAERLGRQLQSEKEARQTSEMRWLNTEKRYALRDKFRELGVSDPTALNDAVAVANLDEIAVDRKTGAVSGVDEVAQSVIEPRPYLLGAQGERERVSAPASRVTGQRTAGDAPASTGDPSTDLARSQLAWLTGPVEEESDWP